VSVGSLHKVQATGILAGVVFLIVNIVVM